MGVVLLRMAIAGLILFGAVAAIRAIFCDTSATYQEFLRVKGKRKCGSCRYCGLLEEDGVLCQYAIPTFKDFVYIDKCKDYEEKR